MTTAKTGENREYVRAPLSTSAYIRRVSDAEVQNLHAPASPAPAVMAGTLQKDANTQRDPTTAEGSGLADFLLQIDAKLDRILALLESEGRHETLENLIVQQTVDISGSGISLIIRGVFKGCRYCQVALKLPGFPAGIFKTYAEVVRVVPCGEEDENLQEVGMKFIGLAEEEREKLIAFVFSQQRKHLRASNKGE